MKSLRIRRKRTKKILDRMVDSGFLKEDGPHFRAKGNNPSVELGLEKKKEKVISAMKEFCDYQNPRKNSRACKEWSSLRRGYVSVCSLYKVGCFGADFGAKPRFKEDAFENPVVLGVLKKGGYI